MSSSKNNSLTSNLLWRSPFNCVVLKIFPLFSKLSVNVTFAFFLESQFIKSGELSNSKLPRFSIMTLLKIFKRLL